MVELLPTTKIIKLFDFTNVLMYLLHQFYICFKFHITEAEMNEYEIKN